VAFFTASGSEQIIQAAPWVVPALAIAASAAASGVGSYYGSKGKGGGIDMKQYDTMTPEQKKYMDYALGELRSLMDRPPSTRVGGKKNPMAVPGLGSLEGLSLAALEQRALSGVDMDLINQGQGALSESLALSPADFEGFFQESVEEPFLESMGRVTDALTRKYAGRARGTESATAFSQHGRDAMTALTRARGQMGMDIQDMRLKALTQVGPMSKAPIDYLGGMLDAGGTAREADWQRYAAAERETERDLMLYFQQLAALSPSATARSFENVGYAQPYQQNPDYGGMVGSGINAAMMMYMMGKGA
jgi:hypothetical protein